MVTIQSDILSAFHVASSTFRSSFSPSLNLSRRLVPFLSWSSTGVPTTSLTLRAFSIDSTEAIVKVPDKPSICTADELHYVSVTNSDWRLALWRYHPPPQAPLRNHPLLLLSGVGTNAIGYDLSPGSSFARYMSGQGFDTWILEVRGAGLSVQGSNSKEIEKSSNAVSEQMEAASVSATNGALPTEQQLSNFLGAVSESENYTVKEEEPEGKLSSLLETKESSGIANQIRDLSQRLVNIIEEGQRSVSPPLFDLQERLNSTLEDFQKQLDLIVKYDWDFDHYLEEDVPAAMEYIRAKSKPKDGKLLAIGHSMGGILLYAMLSRYGFEGKDPRLAAIVTLASSLDYTSSKSTLKLFVPLADPAQALNVPVVPLGALLAAAYPLSSRPPYVLSWLNNLISAEDMMDTELLEKLVFNNFCTIPAKLILQLTTAFREALAGDQDLICPPEAVEETVKLIPEHLVSYKVFGEPTGPHYAHYDLVGGRNGINFSFQILCF
ncbi:Alpha/beta hydrolase family protein [Quillaja saponaria]|uniref:Alpha/beta hydrolase family protein n=1 Tax=Quillaja saponaria TaxID=32244 RepID=A0AAD7PFX3_QUISA|nr:Alpha/beta hydrolase family protein [Quillaja saponaria]